MRGSRAPVLFLLLPAGIFAAPGQVSFSRQIQPVFERSCWNCHGSAVQLSKLDLRTREAALKGGERGPAIVPGNAAQSRLFKLVAGLEKPAMPMDGKLSAADVEAIREWINQGAPWDATAAPASAPNLSKLEQGELPPGAREYWAFRLPQQKPAPVAGSFRHPVDRFLEAERTKRNLKPAPRASRTTLVRRAYLDLIGLPPTPEEVNQFVTDSRADAWEQLIEKLLASPHYGERWGRHWLDVARYADSNGFEHDFDRPNAWRYRDYVIRAFNRDLPYSTFLTEQLAGDEIDWVTNDSLIATGFLRNHAKVGFREKDNPQFRYEYLDDMIATIGRGVLGLTVQCARCHNHKFDSILQRDYYRMQASLYGYVEVEHPLVPGAEADEYRRRNEDCDARIKPLREELRTLEKPYRERIVAEKYKKYPENIQTAIATLPEQRTPGQKLLADQIILTTNATSAEIDRLLPAEEIARKKTLLSQISAIEKERPKPIPLAMGITDGDYRFAPDGPGDEPAPGKGVKQDVKEGSFLFRGSGAYSAPPSYFLIRGDIHSRGSKMDPGFVTVATYGDPPTAIPPADGRTSGRRRALAAWLASRENPLTARVMANRIWHHHFGRGIVATLDNFGRMGEPPTHPELLDWLAVEFMNRGWSIKQMHRLLMTSDAYQMSSEGNPDTEANLRGDPDNHYLWRFRQQRLEAEIVRDAVLAASGTLQRELGGPAVFPPLPEETLESMKNGIWRIETDGPKVWRRSVYVYRKRGLPFPFFEVFDLPDQNTSCGRRNVSTVPTQALTLLNNEFVLSQSRRFAERIRAEAPDDPTAQVERAWLLAVSRPPDAEEKQRALEFLRNNKLEDLAHVIFNLNEFLYVR
jgi:hypothetical protein